MSIKRTPINYRTYYKMFIDKKSAERDKLIHYRSECINKNNSIRNDLLKDNKTYISKYNLDLTNYPELTTNNYIDGSLFKVSKGLYLNKKDDYISQPEALILYDYACRMKEIYELDIEISKISLMALLSIDKYLEIMKIYYNKVHEMMIIEGKGYDIGNNLGWICINRCKRTSNKKVIDFAATKKKEKELIEKGEKIYNKEEAHWCEENGIEYNGVDKRVYLDTEYMYEIAWIKPTVNSASKYKFEPTDYRGSKIRGLTNEELLELANRNTKNICKLPVDIKTKLTLCVQINKNLYIKFIRNEAQKSITYK